MDKKILFIDNHNSFVIKGISQALKSEGFECDIVKMEVNKLDGRGMVIPHTLFVCIDESVLLDTKNLMFFNDVCVDKGLDVIYMGYEEDIAKVKKLLPSIKVIYEFHRPVNAKEVASKIIEMCSDSYKLKVQKHILVVDDSGTMLNTIKGWLEDKYRVSMVNSALNTITFLASNTPDLILLDYEMPNCPGPQLFEMIKSDSATRDIPVIFLTGVVDKESVQKVLALRPAGYLLKSMPKEHIVRQIDEFFVKHQ